MKGDLFWFTYDEANGFPTLPGDGSGRHDQAVSSIISRDVETTGAPKR
jgi:hypothetical protein